VVDNVAYWTSAQRPFIKKMVETIEKRLGELKLLADSTREPEHLVQMTVYATALVMNYAAKGKVVQP
jgi:hypothetical protein